MSSRFSIISTSIFVIYSKALLFFFFSLSIFFCKSKSNLSPISVHPLEGRMRCALLSEPHTETFSSHPADGAPPCGIQEHPILLMNLLTDPWCCELTSSLWFPSLRVAVGWVFWCLSNRTSSGCPPPSSPPSAGSQMSMFCVYAEFMQCEFLCAYKKHDIFLLAMFKIRVSHSVTYSDLPERHVVLLFWDPNNVGFHSRTKARGLEKHGSSGFYLTEGRMVNPPDNQHRSENVRLISYAALSGF